MSTKPVIIVRKLDATIGEVWDGLTVPEQLTGWLGRGRLEPTGGGQVELVTAGPAGGRMVGAVRRCEPPRMLELTWRFEGEPPTLLRFELEPTAARRSCA